MNKKIQHPHTFSTKEAFQEFKTHEEGLSDDQAVARLQEYGRNIIEQKKQKSLFRLFIDQVNNPVIYLLCGAVAVSFIFGDIPEAVAIIVVIILNTMIGFWMEYQARNSVNALKKLDRLQAHVKRNGQISEIDAEEVVPGDVILIEAGDIVPADARVVFSSELGADESPLTGESLPVNKNTEKVKKDAPLGDRRNMLFKGTAITSGKGQAIVTATGQYTEIGSISEMVTGEDKDEIPLNVKLRKLSGKLIRATVGLAAIFFVLGWFTGKEIYLLLQTAIAWTVAAIPEGLPIVASIALARGMLRLARRNVIVKKLAAVETLGETTVIFTDKTGTLTENKLTVDSFQYPGKVIDSQKLYGKNPDRELVKNVKKDNHFRQIMNVSVFCNDARKVDGDKAKGDPLDISLLGFIKEYDHELVDELLKNERIHEDPFDSESKFMGTIHELEDELYMSCKGAAQTVLSRADYYFDDGTKQEITDDFKQKWLERNEELSAKGLKVIACSYRTVNKNQKEQLLDKDDFIDHMIFLGFISFVDPARKDISSSIEKCHRAGIQVIMVTGDHVGTAQNIAEQVHLQKPGETKSMEGTEIQSRPEEVYTSNLFARVDPRQKHEIVDHFKEKGEITAMTGDGVNDAPALKKADIGIAMGKRGTQLAQEVADMVLKDDSFPSIVEAIQEGRIIFGNIRKFIMYQLSYHLAEIIIIAGISFSLFNIPLLPLQLLFLNLLSDVFPALALGLGKGDETIMQQKPKDPAEPIINRRNWITMGVYGSIMAIVISGAYLLSLFYFDQSKETANTIAFFSLAFSQLLHVFDMREAKEHVFVNQVVKNRYVWYAILFCLVALFTAYFVPILHNTLSFEYLKTVDWLLVAGATVSTIGLIQIVKQIFRL